jgi:hypothetical protein
MDDGRTAPRRRGRAAVAAAVLLATLSVSPALAGAGAGFDPIEISAAQIPAFRPGSGDTRFGTLEFRGGLVLSSPDSRFGSLSGLDYAQDGRLVAITDTGFWFAARLMTEGDRPTGMSDAGVASLRDETGKAITGKTRGDAEALRIGALGGQVSAYVSFEGRTAVRRYRTPSDFAEARGELLPLPKSIGRLPRNQGLEAIALPPPGSRIDGALVLIAERSLDQDGNHRGFIVGGPLPGSFGIVRSKDFDVTDAAFLPDGDLLVLERRFSYASGVAMRLRRFAAADIRPGALLTGEVQVEADMAYAIDNMEGLAVSHGASGETLIDIVSDDNQNYLFQRTILLRFALTGGPLAPAAPAAGDAGGLPKVAGPAMAPKPRARPGD